MRKLRDVLTAEEVARVVASLERQPCTARRVRYLLGGAGFGRGRTRLYGPTDVAVMRLAVRLEAAGVSPWVARVAVAYLGAELRGAIARSARLSVRVHGVRADLVPAADGAGRGAVAYVALADVWRGIPEAVQRLRAERPTVWMWRELPAAVAAREVQS